MKIKIISTQIYEDFEEKNEELYEDATVKLLDKNIVINYNNNEIIFNEENGTIEINRSQNNIFIKINDEVISKYETPYGILDLKICGKSAFINKEPFSFHLEYSISFGNTEEYKNIIEVLEI